MMYVGDAKIEQLAGFVGTSDTRLPEKALGMFARTAGPDRMIRSRCPSKMEQTIPAFAAIYVTMLHDFARWRDRPEVIRNLLPATRGILSAFRRHIGRDGLARAPGWHFVDWVKAWDNGVPPAEGVAAENAFLCLALRQAAELEEHFGNPGLAIRHRRTAAEIRAALYRGHFDPIRGLVADDPKRRCFSEHPQLILALAFDEPELVRALLRAEDLNAAGIYFSHYFFEVCHRYRLEKPFHRRLARWYGLEAEGLVTVPEEFENPRSDCHAWSAHPFFHYYATLLGIRPSGFGARRFVVNPMPGQLGEASGTIPTPRGELRVTVKEGVVTVTGLDPEAHIDRPDNSCASTEIGHPSMHEHSFGILHA